MLWFKYWRETRARFWLCGLAICGSCAFLVFYYPLFCRKRGLTGAAQLLYYSEFMRLQVFGNGSGVRLLFLLLILLLGAGGLLRERTLHTAGFTLSLPVLRWQLIASQSGVGLLQTAALAAMPALVIVVLSPLAGESYPLDQAMRFAVLWIVCGIAVFALAFLCSAVFEGEYVAPVISFIALLGISYASDFLKSMNFDFQAVMSGGGRIALLPWGKLLSISAAALLMFGLGARSLLRRDF
jgi:ABC-2 type transport system permease protein